MEPLVSEAQLQTVLTFVQQGIQEGARLVAGGQRLTGAGYERGWYVAPTVFDQVLPGMAIAREEIFGPVLSVLTFDDEADAVRQANATRYGLAGAVWTADLARALRVARAVHAGTFWINQYGTIEMELPFGGFKQSGFGRELGSEAMWEYTEPKSIHVRM
jgi:acyl-CoA reductase-like NAD-dependent aldehyde dehydrogenase